MGMAYTGARGSTADEIAKVMAFPLDHDNMHEIFYKSLMQLKQHPGKQARGI
jgi:serine protease inhibitor